MHIIVNSFVREELEEDERASYVEMCEVMGFWLDG